jgi:hypothetical protein
MEQDEEKNNKVIEVAANKSTASTLLPGSIANVVSLVTRSSSLYLRLGTFVGGLALDGARVTTLTGLELSRALIEAILIRSGREVSDRSIGEVGRAEAEGILDKSVATLHRTITGISFAASTGFHFSSAILSSATDLSQQLLGALDGILGSTDSSRAIASIITLIRREFQNPATGREGEKVGVADLLSGICGLALLQRWCQTMTELEFKEGRIEEVVWDVVILNNGRRADVVGQAERRGLPHALPRPDSMSFISTRGNEVLETIERDDGVRSDSEDDLPEVNLRQRIMRSLPANSSISIKTSTSTTKTITVEITGAQPPNLSLPPGVEIIEEEERPSSSESDSATGLIGIGIGVLLPTYKVVYQIKRDTERSTSVNPQNMGSNYDPAADKVERPLPLPPRPATFSVSPLSSPELEKPLDIFPPMPITAENVAFEDNPVVKLKELPPVPLYDDPASKEITDTYSHQKRSRKEMSSSSSFSGTENQAQRNSGAQKTQPAKRSKVDKQPVKTAEKKNSIRNALKRGSSSTLSHFLTKDTSVTDSSNTPSQNKENRKSAWASPSTPSKSVLPVRSQRANMTPQRDAPRPPQRGNPNYFSSRDLGLKQAIDNQRSPSRPSHYSIPDQRAESVVSHSETYSVHSAESRPGSPTAYRTHLRAHSNLLKARSEKNIPSSQISPTTAHRRSKSQAPSIYTLKNNESMTSLVLASRPRHSAFEDSETLQDMARSGHVDGMFPQHHLVRNITRFVRFASASYGSSFLRVMGIMATEAANNNLNTSYHHEHQSFSTHTQLPADTILLSSFVDPQGGTDSTGKTDTGVPMVHFVSLDHDSKAVVLTCRGTLGFEDVLTDMTCDYDTLTWRGQDYSVHKGIHASARRLLNGSSSRVMTTITAALEEFPDYGLVLCGHSLGGGVTALLAIMISEPSPDISSTAFITSLNPSTPRLLLTTGSESGTTPSTLHLPPGRPIHVYAYGPPATLSPSLRLATRGLITTIVNNQDLVPYLSLGVLHDLQAVALAFKTDESGAKGQFQARVWNGITESLRNKWYAGSSQGAGPDAFGVRVGEEEEDQWAYSALKALRACMLSVKLLPPGEVFVVESCPVLKRDAFVDNPSRQKGDVGGRGSGSGLGRPATRAVLRYVRDVEKKFGEVRFGGSMLLDHSPGRYEASLGALGRGVLG